MLPDRAVCQLIFWHVGPRISLACGRNADVIKAKLPQDPAGLKEGAGKTSLRETSDRTSPKFQSSLAPDPSMTTEPALRTILSVLLSPVRRICV
jgi:hypothetical protein